MGDLVVAIFMLLPCDTALIHNVDSPFDSELFSHFIWSRRGQPMSPEEQVCPSGHCFDSSTLPEGAETRPARVRVSATQILSLSCV